MRFCVEVRFEFYGKHGSAAQQKLLDHQIRLLLPAVERLLLELGGERSLDTRAAKLIGFAALRERIEGERCGKAVEKLAERLEKRIAKRRIEKRLGFVERKVQREVVEEAARVEVLFAETLSVREVDWVKNTWSSRREIAWRWLFWKVDSQLLCSKALVSEREGEEWTRCRMGILEACRA